MLPGPWVLLSHRALLPSVLDVLDLMPSTNLKKKKNHISQEVLTVQRSWQDGGKREASVYELVSPISLGVQCKQDQA